MGERYTFRCDGCGYSAVVSGRVDAGLSTCTETIVCLDCRELMDVVSVALQDEIDPEMEVLGPQDGKGRLFKIRVRCPKDAKHRWELWREQGMCPRCAKPMTRDVRAGVEAWD